ncbi:hypothetical protein, partial [Desulfosarcina cetonica]|uniref:hypothetical protein n=1 Tax=Desulfosarcina cetonica TaxID=90730 RepID=UPI0012EE9106
MKPIQSGISLAIIILSVISILGCSTLKKDWISANEKHTLKGYHEFREKHPNSIWDKAALIRIEQVEWETAKSQDTVDAYQTYIKKYGTGGQYYKKAFEALDNKDWEITKKKDTIQAYEEHLTRFNHRYGIHFGHAKKRIEDIQWIDALNKNSDTAFINYLTQYEQAKARHYSEALANLLHLKPIQQINFKLTNNFSEIPTQKIENYTKNKFSDVLKKAHIFSPETDGLILDFDIKISRGNWYTTVQFGGSIP